MPQKEVLSKEERRLRRAARREKQRETNVMRAAKMHVAQLEFLKQEEAGVPLKNKQAPKNILPVFNVGCSGWFYWHWRGEFYEDELPTNQWFSHYTKHFKTVELNAPFYSWPTVGTVNTWLKQAGKKQVIYTVKVCELITHIKRFKGTRQLINNFGLIADLLGPHMGCFLYQLPPSYHYTPGRLAAILGQLDHHRRNVVEFRHKSWWNEEVYAAFRETNTIFCSCSGPRLPDELVKTADEVYIRFHGTKQWYRHNYTKEELAVWAHRIQQCEAKRVWAYFNNDRDGYAIKNAKALLRQLKAT